MLDDLRVLTTPTWAVAAVALIVVLLVLNDAILGGREYRKFTEAMGAASPAHAPAPGSF